MCKEHKKLDAGKKGENPSKKYIKIILNFGLPYVVKFSLFIGISVLISFFSYDSFNLSLNILMFLSTVTVDMFVLVKRPTTLKIDIIKNIERCFLCLLAVLLIASVVITMICLKTPQSYEENPILFNALRVFLFPFGIISPIFELVNCIPEDD